MFPDFIIIGGMKCGTSSLFYYLSLHPEVGMSDIKEVDFFVKENNYQKGVDWYKARFDGAFKKYGEASPNYSKAHYFEGVPRRMYTLLPDIKLIYLVRDPIARIVSHYTHNIADGREQRSLPEALKDVENNHYIMCSRYNWQLEHFLEYFSQEQIFVVNTHKLKNKRRQTLQAVFDFINVDPPFYTRDYEREIHQTGQKRKRGKIGRLILESPVIKILKKNISDAVKDPVKKAVRPVVENPELTPDLKQKLQNILSPDVKALRTFAGQGFETWTV